MGDELFGRYRLEELIGRGGMGAVHRAVDTTRRRTVALKVLSSDLAADAEFQKRFCREMEIAAQLREPHVIPIHDHGEIDGRLFVDMRLVDGVDLDTVVARDGALSPERAVRIVAQVAGALDAAHAEGLVHRDVKPSNVLLTGTGDEFAYLVDFGVAAPVSGARMQVTGSLLGTMGYLAPELFTGAGYDGRVDVYALSCLLHKLLTGHRPFEADGFAAIRYAHLNVAPPHPSRHAGVPGGFDEVVARGMAKDPHERFAQAGELAEAARAVLTPALAAAAPPAARPVEATSTEVAPSPTDSEPTVVAPTVVVSGPPADEPTAVIVRPAPAAGAPTPPAPPTGGGFRRRWAIAAAVVVVVAALTAVGVVVLNRSGRQEGPPVAAATTAPPVPRTARTYADPDGRFTLEVPLGWGAEPRAADVTDPTEPVVSFRDPTPARTASGDISLTAFIVVNVELTPRDLTAEIEFTKSESRRSTPEATITVDEPITLADGTRAHLLGGTGPLTPEVTGRYLQVVVVRDGTAISVTGLALPDAWPVSAPKLDAALRSLKVGSA